MIVRMDKMPWLITVITHYHKHLQLLDKTRTIKEFIDFKIDLVVQTFVVKDCKPTMSICRRESGVCILILRPLSYPYRSLELFFSFFSGMNLETICWRRLETALVRREQVKIF